MSAERLKAETLYVETFQAYPSAGGVPERNVRAEVEESDIEGDLRFMFREAVADSLANLLDEREARAMVSFMGGLSLESPERVYGALDTILQRGSHVLKEAIAEEFHAKVDLLKRRLEGDPDSVIRVAHFVQMMEGSRRPDR